MEKIEYLYGVKTASWHCMNYQHALLVKIDLANDLVGILLSVPMMERDVARIDACLKACDFNEKLIKE